MIFGEDLTLARVSIDAAGVVRGVATQKAALAGGEADLRGFGRTAEAATGLAVGGFVLAAAAIGAATYTIARHSDAWKGFDEAAKKANHSILNLVGDLSGINAGLESATGWLARFGKIADTLKGQTIASGESSGGLITSALTGTLGWYGLFQKLEAVGKWMDKRLGIGAVPMGPAAPAGYGNAGAGGLPPDTWPAPASQPFGPAAPPFAQLVGATQAIKLAIPPNLADPVRDFANTVNEATLAVIDLGQAMTGQGPRSQESAEGIPDMWTFFGGGIEEVRPQIQAVTTDIDRAAMAFENFGIVSTAAMEASSAAVAAGVLSTTAAARLQEAILAVEAVLKGKIEVAEAVAAAARYDYKSAALHGTAAGLYFAAAAFHGVAAINPASYGFGGVGSRGAAPNQLGLAGQSSPGAPNVTVIVQGSLLGTSKEQLARDVVTLWQKGARDLGGGSAVVTSS